MDEVIINFSPQSLWGLNLALGLIMYGVALEISLKDFLNVVHQPTPVLLGLVSQFLLLPLFTFLLVIMLQPQPSIALGMILVAACPGGNVSNFFTHYARGHTALSVTLSAFATLLAVVMTPLNLQLWGSAYEPTAAIMMQVKLEFWELFKLVALLLLIPLLLGMYTQYKFPKLAKRMVSKFKVGSLIFFVLLVGMALANNWQYFITYIYFVFGLVLLHNAVALGLGFGVAKLFKMPLHTLKAITIETGIQNSGLGLLLIFTFFEGLGGMAIITAFWGIWHLVAGMVISSIWRRKS